MRPSIAIKKFTRRIPLHWLGFAAIAGMAAVTSYFQIDVDFGWHLGAGRYYVQNGIPSHDVFTYTAPNFPWINHEWLSDLIIYLLYKSGGVLAAAAVFGAVWAAAIMVASKRQLAVAMVGVIALCGQFWIRPTAFTALFLALELWILQNPRVKRWWLVPLFMLWANLHGGFVLGLVILTGHIIWRRQWGALWVLAASAAATLVNPYGIHLYTEIWRTLSDSSLRHSITEWGPLPFNPMNCVAIALTAASVIYIRKWREYTVWLCLGLLAGAVYSNRQYLPFMIVALGVAAEAWRRLKSNLASNKKSTYRHVATISTLGVGFAAWTAVTAINQTTPYVPVLQVTSIKQNPCKGNLYNSYSMGGYLIWQLPSVPVYIDGRMPSWKANGDTYLNRYNEVQKGGSATAEDFSRYNIDCALIYNRDNKLSGYLRSHGWITDAADSTSTLWRNPGRK